MSVSRSLPKFKIVLIGDVGVGKTNLLNRILVNDFNPYTRSTIGVEFSSKIVDVDGAKVSAQIWDTAGTERYHSLSTSFYRQSVGAFLVYDVTDRATFVSLRKWLKEFRSMAVSNACITLIGNKCDSKQRKVLYSEGEKFALDNGLAYYETSSLTNENVKEAFQYMIKEVYALHKEKLNEDMVNQSMNMSISSLKTSASDSDFGGSSTSSLKLSSLKLKEKKKKTKCC